MERGCGCKVQNWLEVYNEVEQDVRKSGQFTNGGAIKQEAAKRFTLNRYVPDVRSMQPEWRGDQVIPSDIAYDVTSDGLAYTIDGKKRLFKDGFINKRQQRGLEDIQESKTLLLAEKAILESPNAEVWFPVHNSEFGAKEIRFLAHWKRQGDKVIAEIVRIASDTAGKTLSEAHQMAHERLQKQFNEYNPSPGVFIFSNVSFQPDRADQNISKVSDRQLATSDIDRSKDVETQKDRSQMSGVVDLGIEIGHRVLSDTHETSIAAGTFIYEVLRKKLVRSQEETRKTSDEELLKQKQEKGLKHTKPVDIIALWQPTTKNRNKKSETFFRREYQNRFEAARLIKAVSHDSLVGGGLWALSILTAELPTLPLEKRKRQSAKKSVEVRTGSEVRKREITRPRERKRHNKERAKMANNKIEKMSRRKKVEKNRHRQVKRERYTKFTKEQQHVFHQEQQLLLIFKKLTKFLEFFSGGSREKGKRQRARHVHRKERIEIVSKRVARGEKRLARGREKEIVVQFSISVVFWLLLNTLSRHSRMFPKLPRLKTYDTRIKGASQTSVTEAEKRLSEWLIAKEPTLWLLLSIIWYLVQIRESRGAGSRFAGQGKTSPKLKTQSSNKRKKQTKRNRVLPRHNYQPLFPMQGIIFAAAS